MQHAFRRKSRSVPGRGFGSRSAIARLPLLPLLASLLSGGTARAQNLSNEAMLGGDVADVALAGDLAYVCEGPGLRVLDVSDPGAPTTTFDLAMPDYARGVALAGPVGAVACLNMGVVFLALAEPSGPRVVGRWNTSGLAQDVEFVGTRVLVADGPEGLRVCDATTPSAPVALGRFDTPGDARRIAMLSPTIALVADGPGGLVVVDVSNPAAPTAVGSLASLDSTDDVAVSGNMAFLADGAAGLRIVSLLDPAAPVELGGTMLEGPVRGVREHGSFVFVLDEISGFVVVDVSNPLDPTSRGSAPVTMAGAASPIQLPLRGMDVGGQFACVASGGAFRVLEIADPDAPAVRGGYDVPLDVRAVDVRNQLVLATDWFFGVRAIDVADPTLPTLVGSLELPTTPRGVALSGPSGSREAAPVAFGFVAAGESGLRTLDLTTPSAPLPIGGFDTDGLASRVAIDAGFAYLADGEAGLRIFDVTDPATPAPVGSLDTPGACLSVEVRETLACVANGDSGVHFVDVSDPAAPLLLGTYDTPGTARAAAFLGSAVVVADDLEGVHFLDVSVPTAPAFLSSYDTPAEARDVVVNQNLVVVSDRNGGVLVLDATDPRAPELVGARDTPGHALSSVFADSRRLVVADRGKLRVLRIEVPPPTDLVAIAGDTSIDLEWEPSPTTLLQGYHVERADSIEGPYARLTLEPVAQPRYTDASVARGETRFYRVLAVAGVESEPSVPAFATAGLLRAFLSHARGPDADGRALLQVSLDNAAGVTGQGVDIGFTYDPALLTPRRILRSPLTRDFQIVANLGTPGVVDFVAFTQQQGVTLRGRGRLFDVEFETIPGPPSETRSSLAFTEARFTGSDLVELLPTRSDGSFTVARGGEDLVGDFVPGDVNGDGAVSAADILMTLEFAVGRRAATQLQLGAGDLNGDGRTDSADATLVARLAAGCAIHPDDDEATGDCSTRSSRDRATELPTSTIVSVPEEAVVCDGDSIQVPIQVTGGLGLAGGDLRIAYDPEVLRVVGVLPGDLSASFTTSFQDTSGTLDVALAAQGEATGDGVLCVLQFEFVEPLGDIPAEQDPFVQIAFGLLQVNGELGEDLSWSRDVTAEGSSFQRRSCDALGTPTATPTPFPPTPTPSPTGTVATPSPSPSPTPVGRLINISTRGYVGVDSEVMIAGLIVQGTGPRRVLVSGVGPALADFGVAGVLGDPVLALLRGSELLTSNDDWGTSDDMEAIRDSGFAPTNAAESAIVRDLEPGEYTAILSGVSGGTGVGLVQAFDLGAGGGRLRNISTRLAVGTGDRVMIGGFTIDSPEGKRVVVRALGPTLAAPPFDVAGALTDPEFTVLSGSSVVASNFDWESDASADELRELGYGPPDPREPAVLRALPAGAYTVIVSGAGGTAGTALIEAYEVE